MVNANLKFSFAILLLAFVSACSREALDPLERFNLDESLPGTADVSFCTLDADAVKSKLKFIFIVDKSGSNQDLPGTPPEPGTDPFGLFRYNSILQFLTGAADDPTVSYALINFETESSNPGNQGLIPKATFQTRIEDEKYANGCTRPSNPFGNGCPVDGGWTNYLNALQRAHSIIDADIQAAKLNINEIVASYYVIFMITDGAPIVGGSPGNYTYQSTNDILNRVHALNALAFGENRAYVEALQLHTAYYYNANPDQNAIDLLAAMSNQGNGDFIQIQSGQTIDFNHFSVPVRNVKHTLRDIFVENVNTVWWDGELLADSDGDGLPDVIETAKGSHPRIADSDGNGISDGIENRILGQPCRDSNCTPALAQTFSACDNLRLPPGGPIYGDLDKDKLDDCSEKVILGSLHTNFDSNLDWLPDALAFKFNIAFVEGLTEAFLDPDADGINNYMEAKYNSPPWTPNDRIIDLKKSSYSLRLVSNDSHRSCYNLQVSTIPSKTKEDLIRVYLIENTSVIDDKRFLRIAEKRFQNLMVTFTEGDFQ